MPGPLARLDGMRAEFDRLQARSPWMASFVIDGQVLGSGLNHDQDVRPPHFFRVAGNPSRILELGSCQGGGTLQLARHAGVREVVAIEGRAHNLDKARLVQRLHGATNVVFLQGDLESFEFSALGRFDAVYCVGVLYHLPNPWDLLARLAAVTDLIYINTHFCPKNEVALVLHGYEGKTWREFGHADPLSGLSAWSFWPTLAGLAKMLLDTGFIPEILETDTCGLGQSPHGTTIVARRTATLTEQRRRHLLDATSHVLSRLPASASSLAQARASWLRRSMSRLKRLLKKCTAPGTRAAQACSESTTR